MRLLIAPLVCKLLVFMIEPDLLELLLFNIGRWVVLEVIATTLELVHGCEFRLLISIRVEGLEGGLVGRALGLLEVSSRICEPHTLTAKLRRRCR